jgi:DNA repair photolyase
MAEKHYSSPLSVTSQFYFCPMPLRLDTFSGCSNNCVYCFANNSNQKFISDKTALSKSTEHDFDFIKSTKIEIIKKYFDVAFEGKTNTFDNQEACAIEALKQHIPIHFGGMSDPFQPKEKYERITYKTLQLLKEYDYPVILSTKCKLITEPEYYDLLKDYKNFGLQVSLIDYRQDVMNMLEPSLGTNSVQDRLDILDIYKDKWTAVRIQPVIPNLNESILPEFIKILSEHKVNHVLAEGLKLFSGNQKANKAISDVFKKLTGKPFNLLEHYIKLGGKYSGNDIEMPSWRKWQYIKVILEETKKYNITYGVADNDFRLEGDSYCCCGNKDMPCFKDLCKHNIGWTNFKAKEEHKPITYDMIKNEWFWEGTFRQIISKEKLSQKLGANATYKDVNKKIKDLFMNEWNCAGKNSPAQMIYVKATNRKDSDGNLIYEFKSEEEINSIKKNKEQKELLSNYL